MSNNCSSSHCGIVAHTLFRPKAVEDGGMEEAAAFLVTRGANEDGPLLPLSLPIFPDMLFVITFNSYAYTKL
ncbi:hypothetical protein NC653_024644 [Populus alba x Populus x berolinensis]|uniref:Uncharacterized protein n=1 Tax=Populus alba x Populus x berolinensis TaxID=444605 RepID=A0AAD6MA98_9ROSI|nr:hypothetical protein NC653_024644 [Populus alba x Populus x berolinensis]